MAIRTLPTRTEIIKRARASVREDQGCIIDIHTGDAAHHSWWYGNKLVDRLLDQDYALDIYPQQYL